MKIITYFSSNNKKPPFRVDISLDGDLVFVRCDCSLGTENKLCRHKINALRADKSKSHPSTSPETIQSLKELFNLHSTVRQYMEENWREIRILAAENPATEEEAQRKRKIVGEALENGFVNKYCNI